MKEVSISVLFPSYPSSCTACFLLFCFFSIFVRSWTRDWRYPLFFSCHWKVMCCVFQACTGTSEIGVGVFRRDSNWENVKRWRKSLYQRLGGKRWENVWREKMCQKSWLRIQRKLRKKGWNMKWIFTVIYFPHHFLSLPPHFLSLSFYSHLSEDCSNTS